MAATRIEQPYADLILEVRQGAPWDFTLLVSDDWSGTYTCDVRATEAEDGTLVAEPTITATYSAPDTTFTIALSQADADDVEVGGYFFDIRKDTGEVPMGGRVLVKRTVTP